MLFYACNNRQPKEAGGVGDTDSGFNAFKQRFMDAYWQANPSSAIFIGYGKYYDTLKIPDSTAFVGDVSFAKSYIDSLRSYGYSNLSDNNKIDYKILENQFESTIWYVDAFKQQQWDPSGYNLGGECYEIISRGFAPLNERLKILSKHLLHSDKYYQAALAMIQQPTKEHTDLAVKQNEGSLGVFGPALTDSIKASTLAQADKDTLKAHIAITVAAIKNYVAALKKMLADKSQPFRSFRISKDLFAQKFKFDLVTDNTAAQLFDKAEAAKNYYHAQSYTLANQLWAKYCGTTPKPSDSLVLIKTVIDKIALHHASPQHLLDTAKNLVHRLEQFIVAKRLFNYDTTAPLEVRIMPAFAAGVTLASASGTPIYSKRGTTYYNVADLTAEPAAQAESSLREYNDYTLQILSIHEAMPGHCLQSVYSSNKSPDIIQAVFGNGATVEGWAVYCEKMMLDNGWANNSPEMWLMFYKWALRECCNVIVDYGLQCLNYSKEDVVKLLKNEAFQEDAQIEEKYHRATVSQVQLCSYFSGATDILALRESYKVQQGSAYTLKDFHEKFLSYGSAPVKYISELMLKN
jgi:uncharacterized protein (DUF885 family)